MTVHTIKGNLLTSDCNMIIHQANCMGVMGAGIAKQIVNLYPEVRRTDQEFRIPVGSIERLGRTSHTAVEGPSGPLIVINMYSQYRYGRGAQMTDYGAFEQALTSILKRARKSPTTYKIGMPYGIGCGLAGGKWPVVLEIIERLSEEYEQEVYLYKL